MKFWEIRELPNIESHCNYHLTSKFISFLSKRNSNLFYPNFISFFRFLENVSRQRNSYAHGDIVSSECHHNQQRLLEKCFGNFENSSTSKYWLQFIFKTLKERENQMEFFSFADPWWHCSGHYPSTWFSILWDFSTIL